MTEMLFAFDQRNYLNCQTSFRGNGNQEYYLGDFSIEAGSAIEVRADKRAAGGCSIIRLRSNTRLHFRRSWSHIREDSTDVTVLWFVRRGSICVSHQRGYTTAAAGDFLVTKSTTPFFIECQVGQDSMHEVLHVVVPTHLLTSYIPHGLTTGFSVAATGCQFTVAQHILTDIFEEKGELSANAAQLLVETALSVISQAIGTAPVSGCAHQSLSSKRLHDVLRYIELHLSDPKLCIATVAKGCGISPRYVSILLKLHGSPFSTIVWEQRLKIASRLLSSSQSNDLSISKVAYGMGFKSLAHFSRKFKAAFNMSPSEYRSMSRMDAAHRNLELAAARRVSLQ
jgi:AraC family transcriptional regulator, positive regulator of tynA and feaB